MFKKIMLVLAAFFAAALGQIHIAILPFSAAGSGAFEIASSMPDMLTTELSGHGYSLIERSQIDRVAEELALNLSGLVEVSAAVRAGGWLGATHVLMGSVTRSGVNVRIDARLVQVSTGEILFTFKATGGYDKVFELVEELGAKCLSALSGGSSERYKALVVNGGGSYDWLLTGYSLQIEYDDASSLPSIDLDKYALVLCVGNYSGYSRRVADKLESYIAEGGSVLIESGVPAYLAASSGTTFDLSYIADWFGAANYANVFGRNQVLARTVEHPIWEPEVTETLYARVNYMDGGAAVKNLRSGAETVAVWTITEGPLIGMFTYTHGRGKVFYTTIANCVDAGYDGQTGSYFVELMHEMVSWLLRD